MLSLTTAEKYTFEIDGKPYTLAPLTFGAIEEAVAIYSAEPQDQVKEFRKFFSKRADKRTMAAIDNLAVAGVRDLFQDWTGMQNAGVTPGESERSPDQ